eukprot:s3250_g2.t1
MDRGALASLGLPIVQGVEPIVLTKCLSVAPKRSVGAESAAQSTAEDAPKLLGQRQPGKEDHAAEKGKKEKVKPALATSEELCLDGHHVPEEQQA